jgi:hypothetical protein
MRMTPGSGKRPALRIQPLLRAVADAAIRLGQAIEALADPDFLPVAGFFPERSPALEERPANQVGLLWAFALLVAGGENDGAGRGHPEAVADPWKRSPSARFAGRLSDVLATIDRACARSPRIREVVDELNGLLVPTNVQFMLREASARACGHRPWEYLLENLWALTDAGPRRRRGGYFTPQPIVRFIVRSVDTMLRRELNIAGGLACENTSLSIIDPACGSGAFLLGVTEYIREFCERDDGEQRWLRMARDVLPRRLVGIDVMPACCGATEILLETQLATRWSAHCGNILDEVDYARALFADRVPVIVGNPPYANFGRRNRGSWILGQLDAYKAGLHEKKHNLEDDFIKFLRWGQYWIDQSGCGILAMVTNNTYLRGLTHRQMRASLAVTFDHIYLLDLHGNRKKRERTPAGDVDENVFGIQQGVAIGVFVKCRPAGRREDCRIRHADLWGSRSEKLSTLAKADVEQLPGQPLQPRAPCCFFVPHGDNDEDAYLHWPRLDQIFQQHVSGVQTKCDALFVGLTREEVEQRMRACLADAARGRFAADLPAWLPRKTTGVSFDARRIRPYMVAPWDARWIYYEPRLLGRSRERVMRHLDGDNTALVFMRQATDPDTYDHFLATRILVSDRVFYSAHGAPFVAPLFTMETGSQITNFSRSFLKDLEVRVGARWDDEGTGPAPSFGTRDVFHWIYALVHSPRYRRRNHAMLSIDFPRIPWPIDFGTFGELARLGKELVEIHVDIAAETPRSVVHVPMPGAFHGEVTAGDPRWIAPGTLLLNRELTWFEPIEEAVWQFRIGGYAVLHRWLQQRRHRTLTGADQQHLQRMIHAIRATLRQMEAIDRISAAGRVTAPL